MKYFFVAMCVALAVALSVLSTILATGRIPGRPPPQIKAETHEAEVAVPTVAKRDTFNIFSGQDRMVDELIENLKKEREKLDVRIKDLAEKEAQTQQQKEIMAQLEKQVKDLQSKLEAKIVEMATAEMANIRRLAEVYSKMDPAGASSLLEQMEPERAARVLSMISERQAAAIMDATVQKGDKGAALAAKWSDAIRRLRSEKKGQ